MMKLPGDKEPMERAPSVEELTKRMSPRSRETETRETATSVEPRVPRRALDEDPTSRARLPEKDPINPDYHEGRNNPYEAIKVMRARLTREEFVGAMKFNIYKHLDRERDKNGGEDVRKAKWYLDELDRYLSNEESGRR